MWEYLSFDMRNGYEGKNSSLPVVAGPTIPPADPTAVATYILATDPTSRTSAPTLDQIVEPAAMNLLSCEQLHQFIMETVNSTLCGSQASGAGPSSQLERAGTPGSHGDGGVSPPSGYVLAERDIPFSEHIMVEELPAHYQAPPHLPACDGTPNLAKHIRKGGNAVLLHRYLDGIKCRVFLTA
ncbi:UNVERIFIED_CONTAM: hypothetical protein Sindi_1424200 [Sesamum indicum]